MAIAPYGTIQISTRPVVALNSTTAGLLYRAIACPYHNPNSLDFSPHYLQDAGFCFALTGCDCPFLLICTLRLLGCYQHPSVKDAFAIRGETIMRL